MSFTAPDDSDREIEFRTDEEFRRDGESVIGDPRVPVKMPEVMVDNEDAISEIIYQPRHSQNVAVNTSFRQSPDPVYSSSYRSNMIDNITDVVRDVVRQELKSLKVAQSKRSDDADNDNLNYRQNQNGEHNTNVNSYTRTSYARAERDDARVGLGSGDRYLTDNSARSAVQGRRRGDIIKIPSFSGTEDWQVWITRFEALAYR
jgi:hypothetical protein